MLFLIVHYAFVAQQVERTAVNRDVGGSSPPESVSLIGPNLRFCRMILCDSRVAPIPL